MNRNNLSISNFSNKWTFIVKLCAFTLMIVGYMLHIMPQYEGSYNAALVDKVERLQSIDEPKIILIGNSNLAFGMDSEELEKALGMPVVNMGLHGGLGNRFHENMAKYNVHKGDLYIVCHTAYWDDDILEDPALAWLTIEDHWELWKLLERKDVSSMIDFFPTYIKKCLELYALEKGNIDDGNMYARSSFNEYGDIGTIREKLEYTFENEICPLPFNDTVVDRLNGLNEYLEERGATLLVAGYPIAKGELTVDAKEFSDVWTLLSDELECDVISDCTDYMFDYEFFYDTEYHLNSQGVALRTEQLIKDINNWKNKNI